MAQDVNAQGGADIFVAFARHDLATISPLLERLEELGLTVAFDKHRGRKLSECQPSLEASAREARVVLVCWSRTAKKSKYIRAQAEIGAERKCLVPCWVEGDPTKPPVAYHREPVDLRTWLRSGGKYHSQWRLVIRQIAELCDRHDIDPTSRHSSRRASRVSPAFSIVASSIGRIAARRISQWGAVLAAFVADLLVHTIKIAALVVSISTMVAISTAALR